MAHYTGVMQQPAYEPGQPAYNPEQAQTQAQFLASQLAITTAWPAIARAACTLDADALRRELASGVDVDHQSGPNGQTALQLVVHVNNEMVVHQREGTDEAFLSWVAKPAERRREIDEGINADRIACVELLLAHGASPNPGGEHFPPLMDAVAQGTLAVVNLLLAAGSDATELGSCIPIDEHNCSPLIMAVLAHGQRSPGAVGDHIAVADALLKAGADPNPPALHGRNVMQWAIHDGDHRLWPVLLRGGTLLPPRNAPFSTGLLNRSHPYLQKIDAAGGWKAYEKAHRAALQAIFAPKFTHLVPPELVPLILEFSFHLGFY